MARTRKFIRPVSKESEGPFPAIRVQFKNFDQAGYFGLLRLAKERGVTQTALARQVLCDWVKMEGSRRPKKQVNGG